MRVQLKVIVTLLSVFFINSLSWAGGCHFDDVTPSKKLASEYIAAIVQQKVRQIEKTMNAQGQELNVVFIARRGTDLDGLKSYVDDASVPLPEYLNKLDSAMRTIQREDTDQTAQNQINRLLTSEHLKYSHMGFLLRRNHSTNIPGDKQPLSSWYYITHLLAECDTKSNRYGKSDIFFDQLEKFFWDTKVLSTKQYANSIMIIVPSPAFQKQIAAVLDNKAIAYDGLHEPTYNVAAVPFRVQNTNDKSESIGASYYELTDENSNQWPLEVMAASELPIGQMTKEAQGYEDMRAAGHDQTRPPLRETAQDQLMATNYRPSIVRPEGLKDSVACYLRIGPFHMWDASNLINCKDQTFRKDHIFQLVTVNSIIDYLSRNNLMAENVDQTGKPAVYEVYPDTKKIKALDEEGQALQKFYDEATGKTQSSTQQN